MQKSLLGLVYAVALVFHLGAMPHLWPGVGAAGLALFQLSAVVQVGRDGIVHVCKLSGGCKKIQTAFHLRYTSPVGHEDDPLLWALST